MVIFLFFYFPYLHGCSIKCSYISATKYISLYANKMVLNTLMADPLITIFGHCYFIYICVIYSHLTGERRSSEIAHDNSSTPAAWLHITDCSLKEYSQCLKVSWLIAWEAGAEGKQCLATMLNVMFNFADSRDQEHTVDLSVFLVCMHVVPVHQSLYFWKGSLQTK